MIYKLIYILRAKYAMYRGEPEIKHSKNLIRHYSKTNNIVFIDIGAHKGIYAINYIKYCKKVLMIEPNPRLFRYLNIFKSNKSYVVNNCIGQSEGERILIIPIKEKKLLEGYAKIEQKNSNSQENTKIYNVRQKKLTSVYDFDNSNDDIIFIKIDVEGNEEEVVRSIEENNKRDNIILQIEIEKRHNIKFKNLLTYLKEYNYKSYYFEGNNTFCDVENKINKAFIETKKINWKYTRNKYINNFYFVKNKFAPYFENYNINN